MNTEQERAKLSPCPFCGHRTIFVAPDEIGSGGQWVPPVHVGCNQCKAEQTGDYEDAARSNWNRRAPLQKQGLGEPVAWLSPTAFARLKQGRPVLPSPTNRGEDIPIYATPQPANPVVKESLTVAEPVKVQNEIQAPQDTLMWSEERQPDEGIRYNHVLAESPIGRFSIEWKGWKAHDTYCVYLDGDYLDTKVTLDDAKGFATEHIRAKAVALTGYASAQQPAEPVKAPSEPDPALLISMATCLNHGFGLLGRQQQDSMLYDMRKLWDEVAGYGYYSPANRGRYMAMLKAAPTPPAAGQAQQDADKADADIGRFLVAEWHSTLGGKRLPQWLADNGLRLGGIRKAIEYAMQQGDQP